MRISDSERQSIKEIFVKIDSAAKVYLFGSRVHDDKKGRDIDLLVLSKQITEQDRRKIKLSLYDAL